MYYIIIGGEVMYKLLIVEDDPGIAEGIKAQTEAWGLEVRTVENFRNVLAEFSESGRTSFFLI